MINMIYQSFIINLVYTTNSYIYLLRKLPVFNDLITNDIYSSKTIKKVISFFSCFSLFIKHILLKLFIFIIPLIVANYFFKANILKAYIHYYFIICLFSFFFNNKLLKNSKKKYFSLIVFKMDDKKFLHSYFIFNQFINVISNTLFLILIGNILKMPLYYLIILIVFTFLKPFISETLNILYYKKKQKVFLSNVNYFFITLIFLIILIVLPFIKIYINIYIILVLTIIFLLSFIFCCNYLWNLDYLTLYKQLNSYINIWSGHEDYDLKQKTINKKITSNKKGYDLFNTIFFKRYNHIIYSSSKRYSIILIIIYGLLIYLILNDFKYYIAIKSVLMYHLGWFVMLMYFINRTSMITKIMFYNCDKDMLKYNFYRRKEVVNSLFIKRLFSIIKVNLIPTFIVVLGNIFLLIIYKSSYHLIISNMIFIILLSTFFSFHHLAVYYLIQPFYDNTNVNKIEYTITVVITCFITYYLASVTMASIKFMTFISLIIIIYFIIVGYLINNFAYKKFEI